MVNFTPHFSHHETALEHDMDLTAADVMSNIPTVQADCSVLEAMRIISDNNLTGVCVTSEKGLLEGFLSAKDCMKFNLDMKYYNDSPGMVKDYMSSNLMVIGEKDNFLHIVELFIKNSFHAYPVVDQHRKLLGVVTRTEAFNKLYKMGQTSWHDKDKN